MKILKKQYCILFILVLKGTNVFTQPADLSSKKGIIVLHDTLKPISEKEALLIVSGFGDNRKGRKHQKNYFDTVGYDLYIPFYLDERSVQASYSKFFDFHETFRLNEYQKIHVFSYILGAWIINRFIKENGYQNINTIVYDRSPLQEKAPQAVVDKIPLLGRMVVGPVVEDFSKIPYPTLEKKDLKIGIIIESKATFLVRTLKKTVRSYGDIDWGNPPIHQEYDDLIYTRLNHDEMYLTFEEIGADIMHFIRNGSFSKSARRIPFDWDPMKKYKKRRDA